MRQATMNPIIAPVQAISKVKSTFIISNPMQIAVNMIEYIHPLDSYLINFMNLNLEKNQIIGNKELT